MLTPATSDKLAAGLARLRADQAAGVAPGPGEVSLRLLARYCDLSPAAMSGIERLIKARLAARLLEQAKDDLHPRMATQLRAYLTTATTDNQP